MPQFPHQHSRDRTGACWKVRGDPRLRKWHRGLTTGDAHSDPPSLWPRESAPTGQGKATAASAVLPRVAVATETQWASLHLPRVPALSVQGAAGSTGQGEDTHCTGIARDPAPRAGERHAHTSSAATNLLFSAARQTETRTQVTHKGSPQPQAWLPASATQERTCCSGPRVTQTPPPRPPMGGN